MKAKKARRRSEEVRTYHVYRIVRVPPGKDGWGYRVVICRSDASRPPLLIEEREPFARPPGKGEEVRIVVRIRKNGDEEITGRL